MMMRQRPPLLQMTLLTASQMLEIAMGRMERNGRSRAVRTKTATTVISRMHYVCVTASPTVTNSHPSHANLARDATCVMTSVSISRKVDVGI